MARSDQPWTIRPGAADDAEGIRDVALAAWPATYAGLLPDDVIAGFLERGYSLDRSRRRILAADRFDVAVTAGARVVAFAEWLFPARRLGPDGDRGAGADAAEPANTTLPDAELAAVYVHPDWQRRGIGAAFHERGLAAYRGRASAIVLAVARDNGPALAFYRRAGYAVDAEYVEELLGTGLPELRMRLRL